MDKVLLLTYYWPPSGGAGVQRWLKMSHYLVERGYRPVVVTVDPEKANYPVRDESFHAEVPDEVEVHRTDSFEPLSIYKKSMGGGSLPYGGFANVDKATVRSKISRWIRGNFFIPDARRGWNSHAFRKADELIRAGDIRTVITTGPPHSTHLVGLKLKARHDVRWIADFRDPWTDIYYYDDFLHSLPAKRLDRKYEQRVLESADEVLAVCNSNLELFSAKLPPSETSKVHLVMNGFDERDFVGEVSCPEKDFLEIAYTGTMADSYNVFPVLQAMTTLDIPWKFSIAGMLSPSFWEHVEALGITDRIDFRGYVSHAESIRMLRCADVLLHITPDLENVPPGTSGKLFEYIGARRPILNIGPADGDPAQVIEEARAGRSFTRLQTEGIADFLRKVHRGEFVLDASPSVTASFSRQKMTDRLVELLKSPK